MEAKNNDNISYIAYYCGMRMVFKNKEDYQAHQRTMQETGSKVRTQHREKRAFFEEYVNSLKARKEAQQA